MKKKLTNSSKPIAVLISDVHYSQKTLALADAAMTMAIEHANTLGVPIVVAGDLHDTKANFRAECMNAMIKTFSLCAQPGFILIGNHDRINEKQEGHGLKFLSDTCSIIESSLGYRDFHFIPYYHDANELRQVLSTIAKGSMLIMHQGLEGSDSGEYIQDKSALKHEDVKDFRVISGHYHRRQTIKTGRPKKNSVGLFSFIGNPYTLTFGEANHLEKGFQVLFEDGHLEFIPTNLRKHIVFDITVDELNEGVKVAPFNSEDLIWFKITGTKEQLATIEKQTVLEDLRWQSLSVRFDKIPLELVCDETLTSNSLLQNELLDNIIDSISNSSNEQKIRVKSLWKEFI